jgi:cellobiose phosphorylase
MAFCLVAELKLGRAERAWEIIQKSNPPRRAKEHPEYEVEPYVYCQFVAGPETNLAGQGFHHWLTGTCNWMQYAIVNWLLGARAELDGLRIDPCIPRHWRRFSLRRPFRGATIELAIENPAGATSGVSNLTVNGQPLEGNLIRSPFSPGSTLRVTAVMGSK